MVQDGGGCWASSDVWASSGCCHGWMGGLSACSWVPLSQRWWIAGCGGAAAVAWGLGLGLGLMPR